MAASSAAAESHGQNGVRLSRNPVSTARPA